MWVVLGSSLNASFVGNKSYSQLLSIWLLQTWRNEYQIQILNVPTIVLVFSVVAARKGLAFHLEALYQALLSDFCRVPEKEARMMFTNTPKSQ